MTISLQMFTKMVTYQELKRPGNARKWVFEVSTFTATNIMMKAYINLVQCESKQGTNFKVRRDSGISGQRVLSPRNLEVSCPGALSSNLQLRGNMEGEWGAPSLAGCTGPVPSPNSCWGRRPRRCAALWHPLVPWGLSEANGETTDVHEDLLQPKFLRFSFWLCPPNLFSPEIIAKATGRQTTSAAVTTLPFHFFPSSSHKWNVFWVPCRGSRI